MMINMAGAQMPVGVSPPARLNSDRTDPLALCSEVEPPIGADAGGPSVLMWNAEVRRTRVPGEISAAPEIETGLLDAV